MNTGGSHAADDVALESIRIDKWLWAARFFKTRSLATQAVSGGLVQVADLRVKASRRIRRGETVRVRRGVQAWDVVRQGIARRAAPGTRGADPVRRDCGEHRAAYHRAGAARAGADAPGAGPGDDRPNGTGARSRAGASTTPACSTVHRTGRTIHRIAERGGSCPEQHWPQADAPSGGFRKPIDRFPRRRVRGPALIRHESLRSRTSSLRARSLFTFGGQQDRQSTAEGRRPPTTSRQPPSALQPRPLPGAGRSTLLHGRRGVRGAPIMSVWGAWLNRPLDTIARKDVEQCFHRLTREAGRVQANNAVKVLQALYRRQCIDVPGLHNPVEQWKAVGGRLHVRKRRRIVSPAKLLPRRHRGFETAVRNPVARDAFRFGIYTCMRRAEVFGLAWAQVDMDALTLRIGGDQGRRAAGRSPSPDSLPPSSRAAAPQPRGTSSPSAPARGCSPPTLAGPAISKAYSTSTGVSARRAGRGSGSTPFATASTPSPDRELMLPRSLTNRLVNHARTQGRDRGLRRRLDHGPAPRRRPHRRTEPIELIHTP